MAPGSTWNQGALNQLWICYSNRPFSTLNTKTWSSDDDKMLPECLAADPCCCAGLMKSIEWRTLSTNNTTGDDAINPRVAERTCHLAAGEITPSPALFVAPIQTTSSPQTRTPLARHCNWHSSAQLSITVSRTTATISENSSLRWYGNGMGDRHICLAYYHCGE